MKIKFKKRKLLFDLIPALLWISLGISILIEIEHIRWYKFGYFIIGLMFLGTFIFNTSQHYLTIENGIIQRNGILGFNKKIKLNKIIEIKTFEDYYILFNETTQLKIRIMLIADDSLVDLKHILSELKIPVDKTPFFKSK